MGAGSEKPEFQARFRAMKAEGGWAVVSTEYCAISPTTDDVDRISARLWDDEDVDALAMMCDAAHEYGALAAIELWHGGAYAKGLESRLAQVGPSQIASLSGAFATSCKEMTREDIQRTLHEYARAAVRAKEAGTDIVTVHATEGAALPHAFLLPIFNRRTDEYGGSFENRARFAREALEEVRAAVGGDLAVTMRFTVDTLDEPVGFGDGGVRVDGEGGRFMEYLDDLVDLWDLNVGAAFAWAEDAGPSRTHPENHQAAIIRQARNYTSKPIMCVGRFTNPDTMVEVINSGQADVIGAARPSIADPFLPVKIAEGRFDDIRECIGCNMCISRWETGGPQIVCTQNATIGEEFRRGWHPERFTRARNAENDVLIVGAGPSGMECAVVLGKRGMRRVHLVDAAGEPGGSMRWVSRLHGLGEWARVINWRQIQLDKLSNVQFIPKTRLTAEDVLDYGAEIVVIATGSEWGRTDGTGAPLPGADGPQVLTPDEVVNAPGDVPSGRIVVYDVDGYHIGASTAELLAMAGHPVTLVTPYHAAAPYTEFTLEAGHLWRRLRELDVTIAKEHRVLRIEPDRVVGHWAHGVSANEIAWEADGVVLVTERRSVDGLYHELTSDPSALMAAGIEAVYQIGDCVAPRVFADVIFDGHRLGEEIDSDDPAVALPYARERAPASMRPPRHLATGRATP
jgi:dimethylamine/trimethylamine dehydrogenase